MSKELNLDAYFSRIGYRGSARSTLATLTHIHYQQVTSIAYENIDQLMSWRVLCDIGDIENKMVRAQRGGVCAELNILLATALRGMGFGVVEREADVLFGVDYGMGRRGKHMFLEVAVNGATYLVDAGFGAQSPTLPLPLPPHDESGTPHGNFRIARDRGSAIVERSLGGIWMPLYRFADEQPAARINDDVRQIVSRPDRVLGSNLIVGMPVANGFCDLVNMRLTMWEDAGRPEARTLRSAMEVRAVLENKFRLDLTGVPELMDTLERICRMQRFIEGLGRRVWSKPLSVSSPQEHSTPNASIFERLTSLLRDVFDNSKLIATPELTAHDVSGWDSLGHLRFLLAIQNEFAVRFSASEVSSLTSIGDIAYFIDKKIAGLRSSQRVAMSHRSACRAMDLLALPWLVEPPLDLRERVRRLSECIDEPQAAARRLALHRLDINQLHLLGRAIADLTSQDSEAIRFGILSNGTTDLLLPAVAVSALRHGVWLYPIGTGFGQVAHQALDPAAKINQARCHFVLLSLDHRGLPLLPTPGDQNRGLETVNAALDYIDAIRKGLRGASGCTVILQTLPMVPNSLFGSLESNVPGTLHWLLDRYNSELRARTVDSGDLLLDAATLASSVGLEQWHDPADWLYGKFLFSQAVVPLYADWVGRLLGAALGKARKCLVLDLDNTLWGGEIGDDGLSGIVLGQGSPLGEAHLEVQQAALALRERGILLAVSSKNDDHVARSAFRSHPEMLLRESHIAVFHANWHDKASNLKQIAATLNIGTDALVLLDDNPAERAQVREALPNVAVPELPDDPALFSARLLAAGYFEAVGFTAEDRRRADCYQANATRAGLLGAAAGLEPYLQSLEMTVICGPFDAVSRTRITQLINKTNQFNLTTRRYTQSQVEAFEKSNSGLTVQIRLIDRFGDNGIIAVVICVPSDLDWIIDTWLMSCRVLNRRVEQATLSYIVSQARAAGVSGLIGQYVKTERNGIVKDHYALLGFDPLYEAQDQSRWRMDVGSYVASPLPMKVVELPRMPVEVANLI